MAKAKAAKPPQPQTIATAANLPQHSSPLPWLAGVLVVTLLVFGAATQFDFSGWDDPVHVTANPDIQSLSLHSIAQMFVPVAKYMYHPLTILSYAVNYAISGLSPAGYHLANLLLHLISVTLVFFILLRLFKSRLAAAFGALLFGVHPLMAEPVCWISGRKDVLFAAFYTGAMLCYLRYLQDGLQKKWLAWVCLLCLCGMLSKPMAATLPAALLLLDIFEKRKLSAKAIGEKVLFLGIVAGVLLIPFVFPPKALPAGETFDFITHQHYAVPARTVLAANAVSFYAAQFVAPVKLAAFHPYPKDGVLFQHYLGLAVFILIGIAAWRLPAIRRPLLIGLAFFLMALAPVAQLIPYGTNVYLADRYAYIPLLGLIICAVALLHWALHHEKLRTPFTGIAGLAVIGLAVSAYRQAQTWQNDEALWTHAIEVYPDDAWVYWSRGNYMRGAERPEEALADFSAAIERNPKFTEAFYNRGSLRDERKDHSGAVEDLSKAIQLSPKLYAAWYLRGNARAATGDFKGAVADYSEAIRLKPDYTDALANRGNAHGALQELDLSIADYNKAITLNPKDDKSLANRAYSKLMLKDTAGACMDWKAASALGNAPAKDLAGKYCQ